MPPYVHMPPGGVHTPHGPPCSVLLHGFGALHVGGVVFLLMCIGTHHPLFGGATPLITPPHSIVGSLYIVIHQDISSYVGLSPSIEGFGGVPPSLGRFGGHISSSAVHMLISYTFFCSALCLMSRPCSDYYSSSYSGIFWPVISVSGSFPDRVSSKPWCGSTTTLDAEVLWRCSWLWFCAAAANSIFNASSGLCQLCYGFSTGRFLFQS